MTSSFLSAILLLGWFAGCIIIRNNTERILARCACLMPALVEWQTERKSAAVIPLACNPQRATVRLDDRVRYGQSHSSSLDQVAVIFSAIEFLENHALFGIVDPAAPVAHAGDHKSSDQLCYHR